MLLAVVDDETSSGNIVQGRDGRQTVKLRFLGKDSTPDDSPTLYATDRDSYVIAGSGQIGHGDDKVVGSVSSS